MSNDWHDQRISWRAGRLVDEGYIHSLEEWQDFEDTMAYVAMDYLSDLTDNRQSAILRLVGGNTDNTQDTTSDYNYNQEVGNNE